MENHLQRNLRLSIIRSKKDAKDFANTCDNGDWAHTYGMDQNNQNMSVAWRFRKRINDIIREIRKSA